MWNQILVWLRKGAAYAAPAVAALAAGKENPFPPDSQYHSFVVPVAVVAGAFITMLVHPNGVNGPSKAEEKKIGGNK